MIVIHALYVDSLYFVIGHHASILLVKFDGSSTFAWLMTPDFTYILGYKGNCVCKGYAHSSSPGRQTRPGLKLQFVIGHHASNLLAKFDGSSRSQTYFYPLKVGLRTRLPRVHVRLSAGIYLALILQTRSQTTL